MNRPVNTSTISTIYNIINQLPVSVIYKIATEIKRIDSGPELDDSVFDQSDTPPYQPTSSDQPTQK